MSWKPLTIIAKSRSGRHNNRPPEIRFPKTDSKYMAATLNGAAVRLWGDSSIGRASWVCDENRMGLKLGLEHLSLKLQPSGSCLTLSAMRLLRAFPELPGKSFIVKVSNGVLWFDKTKPLKKRP